jgi:hypothetical protein
MPDQLFRSHDPLIGLRRPRLTLRFLQPETLLAPTPPTSIEGRGSTGDTPAFEHLAKIEQRRDQVLYCFRQVGFEIAPADNTLLGTEVYENNGQMGHAPIRATAGRVCLQMTGRALISLKVNDANATSTSFDPCPSDPRGILACLARS